MILEFSLSKERPIWDWVDLRKILVQVGFLEIPSKLIFNVNGFNGLWVRLITLYDLIIILNEYFAVFYVIFLLKFTGLWLIEGFIVAYAFNVFAMLLFNQFVLKRNGLGFKIDTIAVQPLIYKIFMISLYRYCGLIYSLVTYRCKKNPNILTRLKDAKFKKSVKKMYTNR